MALLEYDIQYDDKGETAKVTLKVLAVEKGDRISYKSNDPDTAIQYRRGSPFSGNGKPKAKEPFLVGKKKGPFTVTQPIPKKGTKLHFDCGELKRPVQPPNGPPVTGRSGISIWPGAGEGTPPGD